MHDIEHRLQVAGDIAQIAHAAHLEAIDRIAVFQQPGEQIVADIELLFAHGDDFGMTAYLAQYLRVHQVKAGIGHQRGQFGGLVRAYAVMGVNLFQ